MLKSDSALCDVPHACLDSDLISGFFLGQCGRSNVEEYMAKDAVTRVNRCVEGEELAFYVMRRTLRYFKDDQWMIRDDCGVSVDAAEAAVTAVLAMTASEAQPALLSLGASLPLHKDIKLTSSCAQKYCVVGMGRWCSAKWRQRGVLPVPRHKQAVSLFAFRPSHIPDLTSLYFHLLTSSSSANFHRLMDFVILHRNEVSRAKIVYGI